MWLSNTIKGYQAQRGLAKDNIIHRVVRKGSRYQTTCLSVMQKSYAMPLRINASSEGKTHVWTIHTSRKISSV
ncbi:unnamed protein product [Trifolium pratense]|uniref:Uncharacterized protein n=1 Tax=Trifolium pratense TaxID=57577 RepID=A0ACB0LCT5_TRIPR|nr:unnamed protein product [Trifolium pratense]